MTKEMRERIEKGIREGESLKEIAKAIDKDPTTISKEVKTLRRMQHFNRRRFVINVKYLTNANLHLFVKQQVAKGYANYAVPS